MYVFLFVYFGPADSGHAFKQIIDDSEGMARLRFDLNYEWRLMTSFELRHLHDAEILWDFEYNNPNYEG